MKALFLIAAVLFSISALAKEPTLNDLLLKLDQDTAHSPFVRGQKRATEHPLYPELLKFAKMYNAKIVWTPSVAKYVLSLPPHPDRLKVSEQDEFDGWFEEFENPNQIILDGNTAMIILVHELRHALHLGSHKLMPGSWYDLLLQRKKKEIRKFELSIQQSSLPGKEQRKLRQWLSRLIETCSEISAHQGDVMLSTTFGRPELDSYIRFISEYKQEFLQNYNRLKDHPFTKDATFLDELLLGLQKFMTENELDSF